MFSQLVYIAGHLNKHPLAGRHKLRAYSKFIQWQLSQLLRPREVVVPFVGNTKLIATKGLAGATGNIYLGLHEFEDMSFLLHFLRKDDIFADIGANIGSYTVLASGHSLATTFAFEPVPATFNWLQRNIKVNALENRVTALNNALGSSGGTIKFTSALDTVNHVASADEVASSGSFIEVEIKTLDSVLASTRCPTLMKIDVEGFETEVMKGMQQTLKNPTLKAIIIELNGSGSRYGYDEQLIHQELLNNGFASYTYNPFTRELLTSNGSGAHNTIYARDMEFIQNRIKSAPKITVFSESF